MAQRHAQVPGVDFFAGEGFGCIQDIGGLPAVAGVRKDHRRLGLKGHLGKRFGNIVDRFDQVVGGRFGALQVAAPDLNIGDGGQRFGPLDRIGNDIGGGQRLFA
jgi:hypothetical protein